jgi:hypothetical protein
MTEKKRRAKATGPRTEVFALRLDPKLKYLAEVGARTQRRSLANFVEWAIEQALAQVRLRKKDGQETGNTVADAVSDLWALDESDRLINLALNYPELMSYDEQLIWRTICTHSVFNSALGCASNFKQKDFIERYLIRKCWAELKGYSLNDGTTKEALDAVLCAEEEKRTLRS